MSLKVVFKAQDPKGPTDYAVIEVENSPYDTPDVCLHQEGEETEGLFKIEGRVMTLQKYLSQKS